MKSVKQGLLLLSLVVSVCACGSKPKPKEQPDEPVTKWEAPPPRPKPTCKSIDDACKADGEKVASIPNVDYGFVPPDGWKYATLEDVTVSQTGDDGPVLAITSIKRHKVARKAQQERTDAVTMLSKSVGVDVKMPVSFRKPSKRKLSGLEMTLWENEAKRGDAAGALLLISVAVGKREIFGIGFAPQDDVDGTKAILAAAKSFQAVEEADDETDDEEGEEDDDDGNKK